MKFTFFLFAILLFSLQSFTQTYRFQIYSAEKDGIFPYVYSLHQDSYGFLWVGTGEGLFRFDGHQFTSYDRSKLGGENFISASISDGSGTNWFGHNNGTITVYNGERFENIVLSENSGSVTSFNFLKGSLWITLQNSKVFRISALKKIDDFSKAFEGYQIYCACPIGNRLLIGTDQGLFIFNPLQPEKLIELPKSPLSKIECIYFSKNAHEYYIGTEDAGIYRLSILSKTEFKIQEIFTELHLSDVPVKDILVDKHKGIWIATMGKGIYNIPLYQNFNEQKISINYNQTNGLGSDNIRKLIFDNEGNLWIGTYGNGLAAFQENYFAFLMQGEKEGNPIFSVCPGDECIWIGAKGKLIRILPNNVNSFETFSANHNIPNDNITSIYLDKDKLLWLGTEKSGVYTFDPEKKKTLKYFQSEDLLFNSISAIDGFGENIFIGTHNGLLVINKDKQTKTILTTNNGLPHNYINSIVTDIKSNVWIATQTNFLSRYDGNTIENIKISKNDDKVKVNSLCFDNQGKLWLATYGNGVYEKKDSVFVNYTSEQGLLSDYCYSIRSDETGTIWVGHRQGLSTINGNNIKQYGKNRGINNDCNLNASCVDKTGILWVGTNNGALRYDYRKNSTNLIPPGIFINSISIGDSIVSTLSNIDTSYGTYKVRIDFIGITFRDPEMVMYSYLLEGYEKEWSELTSNPYALYQKLEDGEYTFLVKAYNADGLCSKEPYKVSFTIEKPIWKKWWFIVLCCIVVIYSFYLFIKIRERNHRRLEEILKNKLDERTKEVIEQKELIEQKNKDITDSINYAKRIQEAILPQPHVLQSVFSDSFIFYLPRDIVSGDFYVFHQTEDKFILICADATGHGVPGAFMSLISSTILKDILQNQILSPSQILYKLDAELQIAISSLTSDGLDVSICQFDLKSHKLTFSSAMRPLILYRKNGTEYIRGSRFSIGASHHLIDKHFDEHEFELKEGDCIYLFSDGFPDQFGGTKGKKLKISELRKWLDIVNPLSMNEQNTELQKMFLHWKGSYSQIDDVLIIGIKCKF
jgi:ligand-binding sensor domain-containing protein/serine phosphatase RsbU (regulator of sigma subunit)